MKLFFILCFMLLSLSGCDEEVSREKISEQLNVEKQISCSHPGYCYGCGLTYAGKYNCGFAMRSCGGYQNAKVNITSYVITYKSGEKSYREDQSIVEKTSSCS